MRAVCLREQGNIDCLTLDENYPDPVAGEGQVVIRVRATSLNYHDVFTCNGMPGIKIPMPMIIGLDIAGEVAEIGPGVDGWSVGDRVLVGMGAIIMDQVVVEDDVMIAAGALVTPGKRLRSKHLYAGTPAREVRALTDNEVSFLPYSAQGYVSLKQRYLGKDG